MGGSLHSITGESQLLCLDELPSSLHPYRTLARCVHDPLTLTVTPPEGKAGAWKGELKLPKAKISLKEK